MLYANKYIYTICIVYVYTCLSVLTILVLFHKWNFLSKGQLWEELKKKWNLHLFSLSHLTKVFSKTLKSKSYPKGLDWMISSLPVALPPSTDSMSPTFNNYKAICHSQNALLLNDFRFTHQSLRCRLICYVWLSCQ